MRTANTDAQADLSLRWAHMPFCWFRHEAVHLWSEEDSEEEDQRPKFYSPLIL